MMAELMSTPKVASESAGSQTFRILETDVCKPPSNKMSIKAIYPTDCAADSGTLGLIPIPPGPSSMPMATNPIRTGKPIRFPTRADQTPASRITDNNRRNDSNRPSPFFTRSFRCTMFFYSSIETNICDSVGPCFVVSRDMRSRKNFFWIEVTNRLTWHVAGIQ